MLNIVKRSQTRFRIQIYDLKNKTSRTISLSNGGKVSVDDLKDKIQKCLEKRKAL